jgi:hypothetical protein
MRAVFRRARLPCVRRRTAAGLKSGNLRARRPPWHPLLSACLSSLLLLWTLFAVPPPAAAQSATTGALDLIVRTEAGVPVSDCLVTVRNTETGAEGTAVTDLRGTLRADHLEPGNYDITVKYSGFLPRTQQIVLVHGAPTLLRWTLDPDQIPHVNPNNRRRRIPLYRTQVTVSATPDLLERPPTGLDGPPAGPADLTVTPAQMEALPIEARRWQSLAELAPGVVTDAAGEGTLSLRGLPVTQNATEIDGLSNDQSYSGTAHGTGVIEEETAGAESDDNASTSALDSAYGQGGRYGRRPGASYTFSQAAVREFRLQGQSTSALYGGGTGGLVTTVTRMGSDHFHGTASLYIRESGFAARDPYALAQHYIGGVSSQQSVQPHDLRQQGSATIGGPLAGGAWRQKLFGFYTFDLQHRGDPGIAAPITPGFYSLTTTQQALLAARGVRTTQVNAALNYLESLGGTVQRRADQTIHFARIDLHPGDRTQLSAAYNRARWESPNGLRGSPVVPRGRASFGSATGAVDTFLTRWSQTFYGRLANEIRAQSSHDLESQQAATPLPQEPAIAPGGYAPEVSIAPDGFLFGTPASLGRSAYPDERRTQINDVLAFTSGRHLIQIGGGISRISDRIDALENGSGTFTYDSGATNGKAGGLVDWITDYTYDVHAYPNGACPSIVAAAHFFCFRSFTQSFGPQQVQFSRQDLNGFVQEDWRIRPHLNLQIGFRYELGILPVPQTPNPALDALFGAATAGSTSGSPSAANTAMTDLPGHGLTSSFPEDRNNIAPRLGLSWQPFPEKGLVLRVGYGVHYGSIPGATLRAALTETGQPTATTRIRITPTTETNCPQVANQGFGYACVFLALPVGVAPITSTNSSVLFDAHFRLPMVQQGSFTLEQPLGSRGALELTYLVNVDRQLPDSTDLNIAPSTANIGVTLTGGPAGGPAGTRALDHFVVPLYTQRVSTAFGPVTDILSNGGGTYHGAILAVHGSVRALGISGGASVTYAKALDYGGTQGSIPRQNGQFDPFVVGYDKARSRLDIPERITGHMVWTPSVAPRGSGLRRLSSAIGGGWSLASIATAQSGAPYTLQISGGTRLPGGQLSINGAGGARYLPSVGRDTLRLPAAIHTQLRLSRSLPLPGEAHLQIFAQVFNITNRRNITAVEQRAYLVGTATNGVTPLIYQDAATIAAEGLNSQPFATALSSSTATTGQREIEFGLHLQF